MKLDWLVPAAGVFNATDEYYLEAKIPGGGKCYIYSIGAEGGPVKIEARIGERCCQFERSEQGLKKAKQWAERVSKL